MLDIIRYMSLLEAFSPKNNASYKICCLWVESKFFIPGWENNVVNSG